MIRETNEVRMIVPMNNEAIFMPSGLSITFTTVVYPKTSEINTKAHFFGPLFHTDIVTATAAELINTSTHVAYAPPCASTSALKMIVTANAMAVKTRTSGLVAFDQLGAIPYRGR